MSAELKGVIELVIYGDKKHPVGHPKRIEFAEALALLKAIYEKETHDHSAR